MAKVIAECRYCHRQFMEYSSRSPVYCSRDCMRRAFMRPRPVKWCRECGKQIEDRAPSRIQERTFCSRQCANRSRQIVENDGKVCPKCDTWKPLSGFRRNASTVSGRSVYCKECRKGEKQAHPCRRYGITEPEYDELFELQGGACAICRSTDRGRKDWRRMCVDHDHETGTVRGLLCLRCNTALGLMQDDPVRMQNAAAYLRRETL